MQNSKSYTWTTRDILPIAIWILIVFITWTFMRGAEHFLALTPEALGKYYNFKTVLIAHITAGGGCLILGIVQFWRKLRTYSWRLHRILGFLYLILVLVSSFCASVLALTTSYEVSVPYAISLQVWSGVWISSTAFAYYFAIKRNFRLHEEWMTRSYIVTLAFVISGLALKIPYVKQLGSFADISPSLFWFGWAVPLYLYELIRSNREFRGRQK